MAPEDVIHLVGEDRGELRLILQAREESGGHVNGPVGEREGIGPGVPDDPELEAHVRVGRGIGGNGGADPLHHRHRLRIVVHIAALFEERVHLIDDVQNLAILGSQGIAPVIPLSRRQGRRGERGQEDAAEERGGIGS